MTSTLTSLTRLNAAVYITWTFMLIFAPVTIISDISGYFDAEDIYWEFWSRLVANTSWEGTSLGYTKVSALHSDAVVPISKARAWVCKSSGGISRPVLMYDSC